MTFEKFWKILKITLEELKNSNLKTLKEKFNESLRDLNEKFELNLEDLFIFTGIAAN